MKYILSFFLIIAALCTLAAQKPQPVQIQTVDTSKYVVEYVPIAVAQKNVDTELADVTKQIETLNKQILTATKRRDELVARQKALEILDKQLAAAAAAPVPKSTTAQPAPAPAPTQPPKPPKKAKAKAKKKN